MKQTKRSKLTYYAQKLRREMTKEERHLWYDFLKLLPVTVNRQKVIGRFIVDFYCASAKLVIELDGYQHYTEAGVAYDMERGKYLQGLGLTIIRYSNYDVNCNFDKVCRDISNHIFSPHPSSKDDTFPSRGRHS